MELLFMDPVFKEAIWGGTKLRDVFDYEIPSDTTGECWAISGHANGMSHVAGGRFDGKTLGELWNEEPEIFGNYPGSQVPLLIKIIDAKNDLSIQVHPDDAYAGEHENGSLGKTECWYVLDCEPGTEIVIGHNAKDKAEVEKMIRNHEWSDFIRKVPVHKGDFFQINPGCLHAIKGGTLLIETQQSSDVTYRVYDYDRLQNGKPRELHVQQSIDCITAPHVDYNEEKVVEKHDGMTSEKLVICPYYTLEKWDVDGEYEFKMDKPFLNVSVIDGKGEADGIKVKKGDHFIVPATMDSCGFSGKMTVMVSYC
jgi:mannose-6-phosphate isomerase